MFPWIGEMKATSLSIKMRAVRHYCNGSTLERTALRFGVHRNTIWRWVAEYRKKGQDGLTLDHSSPRHARRRSEDIEERLIALKESRPWCTVRTARAILKNQGVDISIKGIWSIWQRYGVTGFAREEISGSYQHFLHRAVPADVLRKIRGFIRDKQLRRAAAIINSLPVFPHHDIILEIPQQMLTLRRQVDRIRAEFGRVPLSGYCRKAIHLRKKLERNCLFYSSLWVAIAEGYALMWSGQPRKVLILTREMKKKIGRVHDPRLRFIFLLLEGQANGSLLRISAARSCLEKCKVITRSSRKPHFFMGGLGGIYSLIGNYRDALKWTAKALTGASPSYRQQLYVNLAQFHGAAGDYRNALIALKKGRMEEWGFRSRKSLIQAYAYLARGDFLKASAFAVDTLMQLKKEGVRTFLHPATLILACCHQTAGEAQKSRSMLKEILPLLRKYDLMHEFWQRRMILGDRDFPREALRMPSIRLIGLLQSAARSLRPPDYLRAHSYARAHKLMGIFMRVIPFFHGAVASVMKRGGNPGLPGPFLEMPVFQMATPVFQINFLGKLQVKKPGRSALYLRLRPKDNAFLIHLALNKNRRVALAELYRNFWPGARHPSMNLSHLLTRLRKKLSVPGHFIKIRRGMLIWSVYFTTDYDLYREHIAQANVFERAGEHVYAKRSFSRAIRLFRSAPFKGMYDTWSENERLAIINRFESEKRHYDEQYAGT